MAHFHGINIGTVKTDFINHCRQCERDIRFFLSLLGISNSLKEKWLEEYLYGTIELDDGRRKHTYLLKCGGEFRFIWKDAVVTDLEFFCERSVSNVEN
jgi:hypothetical protein